MLSNVSMKGSTLKALRNDMIQNTCRDLWLRLCWKRRLKDYQKRGRQSEVSLKLKLLKINMRAKRRNLKRTSKIRNLFPYWRRHSIWSHWLRIEKEILRRKLKRYKISRKISERQWDLFLFTRDLKLDSITFQKNKSSIAQSCVLWGKNVLRTWDQDGQLQIPRQRRNSVKNVLSLIIRWNFNSLNQL